ncbi:MAG: DUF1549 and DUF1553 domain-containing protein [Planctomycetaceae bacterium]
MFSRFALALKRTALVLGVCAACWPGRGWSDSAGAVSVSSDVAPSFRNDIMAVLSKSGCNRGSCHGNQHGKGGLKLSLRGQDPAADYVMLTRQLASRRVNQADPAASLLLLKPLAAVPHEGGQRFAADSVEYQQLLSWIEQGLPNDPKDGPRLKELSVTPRLKTVVAGQEPVTIQAIATFDDGSTRDVTRLAVFDSSNIGVTVSPDGVASSADPALTTVTVRYLNRQAPVRIEWIANRPEFTFESPQPANVIDELVFAQLKRLRIQPAPVCDDVTFLRRIHLDVTGRLPTAAQGEAFISSTDPEKRRRLIDELLASEDYVDMQTMRWAELLRAEEKTLDAKGLKGYHQWIRASVAEGKPLNEFAAELIAARGSTYEVPATNLFRALRTTEERAESTAQLFLGVRLTCAKCHNHPFDRWTQDDYYGWSNFFSRIDYKIIKNERRDKNDKHEFVGEQIVQIKKEGEVNNPRTGKPATLRLLGSSTSASTSTPPTIEESKDQDRLQLLAAWIASPDNRRFAETQSNRIWAQLIGRGIVDPIDDFRETNPPSNPELLDAITNEFIASGYDTRQLFRLILNSQTYQLASEPNDSNAHDATCFSHVIPQRLSAEQLLDSLSQVIETPAEFGGHPSGTRAVQLIGVRNGEFRYAVPKGGDRFLMLFGRPSRLQSCECERGGETTLAQTFEMVSGEMILQLLKKSKNRIDRAVDSNESAEAFVNSLYWSALTRPPNDIERKELTAYIEKSQDRRGALEDVTWAVLNSNEFLLRR